MTNQTSIEIIECDTETNFPVFCRYPGQTSPQSAYIELDLQNKTLAAYYNSEIGNAVPFSVWHGHDRRYWVPSDASAHDLNTLMAEIAPVASRLYDGYESEWNGSNHVARLTEDAEEAELEIEAIIERFIWEESMRYDGWDEWYVDNPMDVLSESESEDDFDNRTAADLSSNGRVLVDTRKSASEWAIEWVIQEIENTNCDWTKFKSQLPQWILKNDNVIEASADWED